MADQEEKAPDYRAKYRQLLEELESKEKSWEGLEQSLRRTLAHLVVIAQGPVKPDVLKKLEKVRDFLRSGGDLLAIEKAVDEIRKQVLSEEKWAAEDADLGPVHEILIRIIEQIPLPAELAAEATEIKKTLEGGLTNKRLPWAINAISSLVLGVRSKTEEEKRELAALLDEVSSKLAEMEAAVHATHTATVAGFDSNRSLDEKVRAEVKGIQDSAAAATDLGLFRRHLTQSLDAIRGHLETKSEEDFKRESELKAEVEKLRHHVETLESEVSTQRQNVKKALEEIYHDALTGCLNRLAFNERISMEHSRASRYGHPLSLVMFDLDHFKSINDNFGHQAGDQVLRAVALIASKQLRDADAFCRYGGEEFVAIFPETGLKGALAAAEKVRQAVEDFKFHSHGNRVVITISSGVAELRPGEKHEEFLQRADQALYKAKGEGRNRCVVAG